MTTERKRLVIAVDCDDVLVATARHAIDDYNDRFGTQVGLENFYDTTDATLDVWGVVTRNEATERAAQFLHSAKHAEITPKPEAVEAIKSLAVHHELHPHHGENALEAAISKVILFGDYPWNQRDSLPERMVHCKDWLRVMKEVEMYAAG